MDVSGILPPRLGGALEESGGHWNPLPPICVSQGLLFSFLDCIL